jgi:hypothetical protein
MQEFYFRFNNLINWTCWSIIVISIIVKSLNLNDNATGFLVLGFTFLFLHYLLRLVIPIQFDYDVKKENDAFNSYINFQKILTVVFNISLALFFLGFMFKAMHWPGASILIVVSLIAMSFYFLFVKKTFQKNVILQVVLSITIFVCLIGVMFRFQHWNGTAILKYSSAFLIVISLILTLIYRKNIRKSIKRTVYILFIFSVLFVSDYLRYSFSSMNFNYSIYERTIKLEAIENKIVVNSEELLALLTSKENSPENSEEIKQLSYNIDYLLRKIDFDFHDLGFITEQIIDSPQKNDFILAKAESWMESYISKYPYWQYRYSYAKILLENKKYDKALEQAILAKKEVNNKENQMLVKKIKRAQESENKKTN